MKTSTIYVVERSDWYGECETVANFHTRAEALAHARKLRTESKATDDPADKVKYTVTREIWTREE